VFPYQLPCEKCHADIFDELKQSAFHRWDGSKWNWSSGATSVDNTACYGCHRANKSITYAKVGKSPTQVTPGKQAHAASVVACMLCHQFNASEALRRTDAGVPGNLTGFEAGGFDNPYPAGTTPPYNYTNISAGFTGGHAAHQTFIERAIAETEMLDANEACIACHTRAPVRINWSHRVSLEFNVTPSESLPPTHFNITQWWVNGTTDITVWGNTTGSGLTNTSAPGFSWPGENPANYTGGGY